LTVQEGYIVAAIKSGRVRLPADFRGRLDWLPGSGKVGAWLFIVQSGRCRLLSPANIESSPRLRALRQGFADVSDAAEPDEIESAEEVALGARLFETSLESHRGGWRLTLPSEVRHLLDSSDEGRFVFLTFSLGFLEIWAKEFLFNHLRLPLDHV